MDRWGQTLLDLASSDHVRTAGQALAILGAGILAAQVALRLLPIKRLHPQHQLVTRRIVRYLILGIALAWSLRVAGINLSVLLGTAGILTVAIGFAAQTSTSNLISGIFLMAEQPFVIGDVIRVGEITGEVVSVGLLSVRVRTFDNLLVRTPNEAMLKSNVTNLTHFPIRRYDMMIGVAYKEDLKRVRETLQEVASRIPICLEEPKPLVILQGFGESSVDLQFSVWATRDNYLELRNTMFEAVKKAFDEKGIEFPFPHRTLFAGSSTGPFPVSVSPQYAEPKVM